MDAEKARMSLEEAFEQNDFAAFNRAYNAFLDTFPAFREALTQEEGNMEVKNPMFGRYGFSLKRTQETHAAGLYGRAQAASRVLQRLTVMERLEFLKALQRRIEHYKNAMTLIITADTGKPIDLASGEMAKGNEWFSFSYEQAPSQLCSNDPKMQKNFTRPIGGGVALVIGAFNYPYALSIGGIVGAIAAGNGVVVSANSKSPNWVFVFLQAAWEAAEEFALTALAGGRPWAEEFAQHKNHLIQITVGVNRRLVKKADIVHFVGGDATAKKIGKARLGKRTVFELGGSNVVTVMASAVAGSDDKASYISDVIYQGFAYATGQRCTAPRILCLQKGAENVALALKARCFAGSAQGEGGVGNPFKTGTKIGPLVDAQAYAGMQEAITLAQDLGASVSGTLDVSVGIITLAETADAHWVNPVIIDWSTVHSLDPKTGRRISELMRREIFGPLLHIVAPVETLDKAVAVTQRLDSHGLAGAIFTSDHDEAVRYRAQVRATSITENKAPKDQSPSGPHGHPGQFTIGGAGHFLLYAENATLA